MRFQEARVEVWEGLESEELLIRQAREEDHGDITTRKMIRQVHLRKQQHRAKESRRREK